MAIKLFSIIILFFSLQACSNLDSNSKKIKFAIDFFTFEEKPYANFKREDLDKIKYPLIEVRTNDIIKQLLLLQISLRDGYANYYSGSGQTLTMNGALVTKTNGFNADLISLEIQENSPLLVLTDLKNWNLFEQRKYKFVTPGFIENLQIFNCDKNIESKTKINIFEKTYELTKITENCKNNTIEFQNIYWSDQKGYVWMSKQWVSKKEVYMDIRILNPETF
tara:strand:- start:1252 stop:1917 length:666 start_codon:yes stop_codon:yes gene_type:complete